MSHENIKAAITYSNNTLATLRDELQRLSLPEHTIVVAVGSLARREASSQSDIDYFVVSDVVTERDVLADVCEAIHRLQLRAPSPTGAFAKITSSREFLDKIGGNHESNDDLTRRMLFLLESDWIHGENGYEALFDGVIERYISEGITQHQLARFFLNDLIRYYRTICVDFEYKTVTVGKSWGDRNIKLMFSRKLLYFSGVLAAAATAQSGCGFKRSELKRLLRMPPIKRVEDMCGSDAHRILDRYNQFLGWLADVEIRELLRKTSADRKDHSERFRAMKNAGHHFSWDMESLFHQRFAPTHPINQALMF